MTDLNVGGREAGKDGFEPFVAAFPRMLTVFFIIFMVLLMAELGLLPYLPTFFSGRGAGEPGGILFLFRRRCSRSRSRAGRVISLNSTHKVHIIPFYQTQPARVRRAVVPTPDA